MSSIGIFPLHGIHRHQGPHHPDVHPVPNTKPPHEEKKNHHEKKVHFEEHEKKVVCDSDGNCRVNEEEENIDAVAGGFIQDKHRAFELCKWKTFKA